jgi:molybdopterin synthase sulfur carrier subunit
MVIVDVRLYGPLREVIPGVALGERMEVELPNGATVGQLVEKLGLPADQVKVVFVNHTVREEGHELEDGDRVAVFPPVGGG